jgi:hypothetical protein
MRRLLCAAYIAVLAFVSEPALARDARDARTPSGPLILEEFFRGELVAEGRFVPSFGEPRGLKVAMHGRWDHKTQVLTLVEDFVFSDGEMDRKTWRFTKRAPGRYTGTREDVIGEAEIVQEGNDIRLSYRARLTTKSGTAFDVAFADRLAPVNAREVRNTANVTWWIIPAGTVELVIRRKP